MDSQMSTSEVIAMLSIIILFILGGIVSIFDPCTWKIKLKNDSNIYEVNAYDVDRKITNLDHIIAVTINGKKYNSNNIEWYKEQ